MEVFNRLKRENNTRNKLWITIMILFCLLIGYRIPLPGINTEYLKVLCDSLTASGIGGFVNAMTGSSFSKMSIFALSITPYITASIILQLLTVIVPRLEAMSKDGSVGHQKMERLTFIVGAIIAIIESLSLAIGFGKQGLFVNYTWYIVLYATIIWTAGACFLIWVGQTITNKLIGNGTSLILLFNMLTTLPGDIYGVYMSLSNEQTVLVKIIIGIIMAIVLFVVFAYVVVMSNAEERIVITNSSKSGVALNGANNGVLPLKLNIGGVMPIIFSSSIMSLPVLIANLAKVKNETPLGMIVGIFNQSNWFNINKPIYSLGVLIFILLTFVFAHFYAVISFNTKDIADSLRKNGSIINGLRPGQPTADYLKEQVKSIMWIGTTMLLTISLIPTIISGLFGISSLSFGGTTIIIIVGVILELKNTIMANTSSVAYKSLIKSVRSNKKR